MTGTQVDVAVAGLGAIGWRIVRWLDGGVDGLRLTAVSARDVEKAETRVGRLDRAVPVLPLDQLAPRADVVVECVPAAAFDALADSVVAHGKTLMTVTVGRLLNRMDLVDQARETGARIVVPTGALIGLDAVRAAAEGRIESVRLITRKPPKGLAGAPYLKEHGIDVAGLTEATKVFEGTAREGAIGFPANVNVAAALSLAGIGPDRTRLEIWADPAVSRNMQSVTVEADSARFSMTIENVPSDENPRTGKITALSVMAALRRLVDPLQVGT